MPLIEFSTGCGIITDGVERSCPDGWDMEKPSKVFDAQSLEKLTKIFAKNKVSYLIIGKFGAIIYGFPDTTQDIDVFPEKAFENGRRIAASLKELGFAIDSPLEKAILEGKDFIQIRGGPFDIDLIFAPDGLESFEEARKRSSLVDKRYPVASLDDIIKSKKCASRQKDKEVIDRLKEFAQYLKRR